MDTAINLEVGEDVMADDGLHEVKPHSKRSAENICYHRTKMKQDMILQKLKERGYKITRQRKVIIDTILENECSCCKDIYYKASCNDDGIGIATIYRVVNILEEIGAINRRNMYKVSYSENSKAKEVCTIVLDDHTTLNLSENSWKSVIKMGLIALGYLKDQNVESITLKNS